MHQKNLGHVFAPGSKKGLNNGKVTTKSTCKERHPWKIRSADTREQKFCERDSLVLADQRRLRECPSC